MDRLPCSTKFVVGTVAETTTVRTVDEKRPTLDRA